MLFRHWKILLTIGIAWGGLISLSIVHTPNALTIDQWQMAQHVLGPYYAGEFGVTDLITSQNSHLKIGYRAMFLLNAIFFDLNTRYEMMLGLLLLLGFVVLLFRAYLASSPGEISLERHAISFLALLPLALSFNRTSSYIHPLISVTVYTTWVLMLLFWSRLEKALREGWGLGSIAPLTVLLVLLVFGVTGGGAPSILVTSFCMIALSAVLSAERRREKWKLFLVLLVVSASLQLVYWKLAAVYAEKSRAGNLFANVVDDPVGAVEYVLSLFANSALNDVLLLRGMEDGVVFAIGAAIALLYLIAIVLYFRTQMYQRTYLPIVFIIFTAFVIGALLSARFGRNWGYPLRSSFANSPQLGLMGMFWIFIYSIGHYWVRIRNSKPMMLMVAIPFCLLVFVEWTNIKWAKIQIPKAAWQLERSIADARDLVKPKWSSLHCPNEGICNGALVFLRHEKLSLFAEGEDQEKARKKGRWRKNARGP